VTKPYPSFLLCCRCSEATEVTQHLKGWHQLVTPRGSVDICPSCALGVLAFLKTTPDPLEENR